jgi:maltose alpha-D-glucosyltransferase/alpha-amylase
MVTDEERDYMYRVYAHDPQMRINLGIRRRLAPLLGNHRRRIELLNGLLMSLPGTPVIYYGDEIGMGDNVYLGDRNGVRTPMQWSGDRNAGFSSANSQRLFLPVITDPEYHFQSINVDMQQNNQHSLLWWMKRLIALRRAHPAFGRGSLTFLHPENRRVVAFIREYGDEKILVVANTSRFVQYVELDMADQRGLVPVEMFGRVEFPRIEEGRPLPLTLAPHGFLWFTMEPDPSGRGRELREAHELPPVIEAPADLDALLSGPRSGPLLRLLSGYLRARRWFRSKARRIKSVTLRDWLPVPFDSMQAGIATFNVEFTEGESELYVLPLALVPALADSDRVAQDFPQAAIARITPSGADGPHWLIHDALYMPGFDSALLNAVAMRRRFNGRHAFISAHPTQAFRALTRGATLDPRPRNSEQSNTSISFGDRLILKVFRRLETGINPDLEIGQALTDAGFEHVPAVAGWLAYRPAGDSAALGIVQQFVENQSDAWEYTLGEVGTYYERAATFEQLPPASGADVASIVAASLSETSPGAETIGSADGSYLYTAQLLGQRTGELHRALAGVDDPAFRPEPFTALYQRSLYQTMRTQAGDSLATLGKKLGELPETAQDDGRAALARGGEIQQRPARRYGPAHRRHAHPLPRRSAPRPGVVDRS